jgi:hypothetical protein
MFTKFLMIISLFLKGKKSKKMLATEIIERFSKTKGEGSL